MEFVEKRKTGAAFEIMRRHPYMVVIIACAVLFPFGWCERDNITAGSVIYLGTALALIAAAMIFFSSLGRDLVEKIILFISTAACISIAMYVIYIVENRTLAIFLAALAAALLAAVMMRISGLLSDAGIVALMILLGIAIRFVYVLYTDSSSRQHDVGFWRWTWGHANYIEYWFTHGLNLPDFDVRSIWQYYHPPLHHWLMALLLKILVMFKFEYEKACQALQILPMLYSSLIMVVSYRIFRFIKLKGTPLFCAMAIMCFHPTFILMAGFFNNDVLSVLFIMSAVMWALRWYARPTLKNIIPIALSIGLGMMTKLSAWMAAPAVAFFFLFVFFKNLRKWQKFIGQFALFGVICAPLGLWWQVRNLIAFDVPITYVPYLNEGDVTYCGNLSVFQRLFDFSGEQLTYVYDAYTAYDAPYNEFNPTLGLLKTALFGEGQKSITSMHFPQIMLTGPILFWVAAALFLLAFVSFVVMMISKKSGLDVPTRIFFSVLFLTFIVSYYLFCFSFPFTCTMNIRYCVPVIPLCAIGLGLMLKNAKKEAFVPLRYAAYALTAAFSVMSVVVYNQVGML